MDLELFGDFVDGMLVTQALFIYLVTRVGSVSLGSRVGSGLFGMRPAEFPFAATGSVALPGLVGINFRFFSLNFGLSFRLLSSLGALHLVLLWGTSRICRSSIGFDGGSAWLKSVAAIPLLYSD